MLIETSGIKINVSISENVDSAKNLIVFLHGFTGSLKDWDEVRKNISPNYATLTLDLIGHGLSDSPAELSFYNADSIIKQIFDVINHFNKEKIVLVGYSMGGRAALSFAEKYPEKIKALVLESTSPGIKDEVERNKRKQTDDELAEFILANPIENFVDKWMNLEIFKSQKSLSKEKLQAIRNQKLLNNKIGLANSLRGFGTGVMPELYDSLSDITVPTLLITGELDEKFTKINSDIVKLFPIVDHKVVNYAGHNTHLEKPDQFISVMNNFIHTF